MSDKGSAAVEFSPHKVVKIPVGEAPIWVRREWLGLILSGIPQASGDGVQVGVESGKIQAPKDNVIVAQEGALEVLAKKSPAAAIWFTNRGMGERGYFSFGADELVVETEIH